MEVGHTFAIKEEPDGHCGSSANATTFQVRGPKYLKDKVKISSDDFLYSLAGADLFATEAKVSHIGKHLDFKKMVSEEEGKESSAADYGVGVEYPELVIVNFMIPGYEPKTFGKKIEDGAGYHLVMYFKPSAKLREDLKKGPQERSPGTKLLGRFLSKDMADPSKKNFKGIARVNNLADIDLNSTVKKLIEKYNSTPFLIRDTISFDIGPGYFEINVDVHRFGFIARKGLFSCTEKLSTFIWDMVMTVQADKEDELPEQLFAGMQICKVTLGDAKALVVKQ